MPAFKLFAFKLSVDASAESLLLEDDADLKLLENFKTL